MERTHLRLTNEITKSLREKSGKSVVRIYATGTEAFPGRKDIGEVVGTGLILRLASKIFIVTARHLLNDFQNQKVRDLGFLAGKIKGNPIRIFKNQINLKYSNKRDDIGVVDLNEPQIEEIRKIEGMVPLEFGDVFPDYEVVEKCHVAITGFPSILAKTDGAKKEIGSVELLYVGMLNESSLTTKGYKKSRHFMVDFKNHDSMDTSGNPIVPPAPIGVSGGTVWTLADDKKTIWTPSDVRAIGICHTWYNQDELIVATRMNVLLELVAKMYPRLEGLIRKSQ